MNFVNRMGQMMAERADLKRMNIVERTELWYRLERIGQPPEPLQSKTTPPPQPTRVIHHYIMPTNRSIEAVKGKIQYDGIEAED